MTDEMMLEPDVIDFDTEMEKLAVHIMAEAKGKNVKLEDKIKAFEAIQPYHAAREKYKGKAPARGANGKPTFGQFKSRVQDPSTKGQ